MARLHPDVVATRDNAPVIVERAEGRELIDVDGNRYLDAISSLWVTTLGHRVPELDAALRDQLDRVAHSTLLGNGNRVVIELAEALARVVPVDEPHFLFASDGAAAVEQALKIAFQYWTNQGESRAARRYLAFGGAYHGDTSARSRSATAGSAPTCSTRCGSRSCARPGFDDPDCFDTRVAMVARARATELAAVVVEPLVQGAARHAHGRPRAASRGLAAACREHDVLLIARRGGHRLRPHRHAVRLASSAASAPTCCASARASPAATCRCRPRSRARRVYDAFLGPDLCERTFYHGHSYSGNALAAAVALRHLAAARRVGRARQRPRPLRPSCRRLLDERVAHARRGRARSACAGLMAGVELAPPRRRPALGPAGRAPPRSRRGVLLRPLGDVVVLMPPLTITAAGDRPHRRHAGRRASTEVSGT